LPECLLLVTTKAKISSAKQMCFETQKQRWQGGGGSLA
jgi:hypothetical protein